MSDDTNSAGCVGRIAGVFGVKGWVKIISFAEPEENLFEYSPWRIDMRGGKQVIEIDQHRRHKNGWVAHIKGVDDRDLAEAYTLKDITVDKAQFVALDNGDYYWHQLIGMRVSAQQADGSLVALGVVEDILETGANDVLVVSASTDSIDDRERLIPYIPNMYVKSVNIQAQLIEVDWHLDD